MEANITLLRTSTTWDREVDIPLIEAAKAMNKEAIASIFDRYARAVYNYALRLCNDPLAADHVVGDVFAKLLDQLAAKKGPTSNLRSYLFQITYHLIIDQVRASYRQTSLEVAKFIQSSGQPLPTGLENQLVLETLFKAIQDDLTGDQRHVIILRFLEGFSILETADIMRITGENVKVIQNRAIAKLRKALASFF